ncbi:MAG: putative ABC transporter permease [Coriobacteriales bacterium]|jgi:uncharacterized membrane protein|nr:putative ABC transporter permease [Coriobacteriales bacterium]
MKLTNKKGKQKLGFMRFWQFYYAFIVVLHVLTLMLVDKSDSLLTVSEMVPSTVSVMFCAVMYWLIWQRKAITKYAVAICVPLWIVLDVVLTSVAHGGFSWLYVFYQNGHALALVSILYFFTSRRVKAVLTKKFSTDTKEERPEHEGLFHPRTWAYWRNIIIYFCLFSIVGHWMEAGYCLLIKWGLIPGIYDPNSQIWSDWLYPFIVYGFGVVACAVVLYPLKNLVSKKINHVVPTVIVSFIMNALVCTIIELTMGLIMNQNYQLWDYRDMFGNFMGQVCLQNAMAFGAVATLCVWVIYPLCEWVLGHFSKDVMMVVFVAVAVFFAILMTLYCMKSPWLVTDQGVVDTSTGTVIVQDSSASVS